MKLKSIAFLSLFISISAFANFPQAPTNMDHQKFKEYYFSGEYHKDIEKKLADAKSYLDLQIKNKNQLRLAIVMDVDETALSNYLDLERLSFTENLQAKTAAYMMSGAQAIPAVLELYQYAIANNVAVFFISERPNTPEIMNATVKNLKLVGYTQWEELLLKPLNKDNQSNKEFKTQARRHIALQGFDTILNIGDQEEDLVGGYAQAKVKIPNPFYGTVA